MKYRNKEVVEAFQITEETRRDNSNWPEWMHSAWRESNNEPGSLYPSEFPDSDGRDKLAFKNNFGEEVIIDWGQYLINSDKFIISAEERFLRLFNPLGENVYEDRFGIIALSKLNADGTLKQ